MTKTTPDRRSLLKVVILVAGLAASVISPARAETTADIQARGSLTFGVVTDQIPFGFINEKGENDGYDISLARMMAKELGVEPKFQPITSANRIPQLLTGKVDILICAMGMYPDRARVVQFSRPYGAKRMIIYGPKASALSKAADLAGRSVAVEKGSSMDKALTEVAPKDTVIRRYDDASSAVQALASGQTEFLGSYSHMSSTIEKVAPGASEPKVVISVEYKGIAMRPHQPELTDWIDDFVARHERDGTLNTLYRKWFGTNLPELPAVIAGIPYSAR